MNRNYIAIVLLVALVAVGGVAAALVTGFGPAPGGDSDPFGGSEETPTPYENTVVVESGETETAAGDTATESTGGTESGDGTATSTATPTPDPFAFVIENITECGTTCREVEATIVNQQNSAASGVTVRSEIYTDGDKIWEGSSEAGEMAAGESYTDTKTVELSLLEANAVRNNDGQVLIKTFVVTDSGTYVFKEQRNVM